MSHTKFNPDFLRSKEIAIKTERTPSAQINTLCNMGNAKVSLNDTILTRIEQLKKLDSEVYIIARLQFNYGLRISEVLKIKHSDITNGRKILINGLKGSESKIIDVSEFWVYFSYIKRNYLQPFRNVDRFYVYRIYKKIGLNFQSEQSTKSSVTHSLRHLYVKDLREAGIDKEIIKKSIGHKNDKNTDRYGRSK